MWSFDIVIPVGSNDKSIIAKQIYEKTRNWVVPEYIVDLFQTQYKCI